MIKTDGRPTIAWAPLPDPAGPDIAVENHGSILLFRPATAVAAAWLKENVAHSAWQWFGGALAVEPRYADSLIDALSADGLTAA